MARVTVEDCLQHVDNRFNLVLLATRRARQLSKIKERGLEPLLAWENDKATVVALREIAAGLITKESLDAYEAKRRAMPPLFHQIQPDESALPEEYGGDF